MDFITVIVPVRNESRCLEQTLRSLLNQDYPATRFEVLVADGGSTDATVPIVRKLQSEYENLHLLFNAGRWSSQGRNLALRHMRGECAVVVDGHCHVPDTKYLQHLANAFALSRADCLGRPQPLNAANPTPFQQAVSVSRHSRLGHNPDSDIYSEVAKFVPPQSTAIAYRKEVFERIGFFDEHFDACEDVEFNQRVHDAGFQCYFEPKLKIVYHPRGSWLGLFQQLARYGTGRARLARKNFKSLTPPALVPPGWTLWVFFGALLSLALPPVAGFYAFSIAFYFSVLLAAGLVLGRGLPWGIKLRIPSIFVGIHFGFGYGFIRELCRSRR